MAKHKDKQQPDRAPDAPPSGRSLAPLFEACGYEIHEVAATVTYRRVPFDLDASPEAQTARLLAAIDAGAIEFEPQIAGLLRDGSVLLAGIELVQSSATPDRVDLRVKLIPQGKDFAITIGSYPGGIAR